MSRRYPCSVGYLGVIALDSCPVHYIISGKSQVQFSQFHSIGTLWVIHFSDAHNSDITVLLIIFSVVTFF